MGWFRIVSGPNAGTKFYLGERSVTIGRDPANPIQIIDEQVSRHHAYIRFEQGRYTIADMKSANGLLVNGRRVQEAGLDPGDRITIGRVEFEFEAAQPTLTGGDDGDLAAREQAATSRADAVSSASSKETRVLQVLDGLHDLGRRGSPTAQLLDHLLPGVLGLLEVDRVVVLMQAEDGGKLRSAAFLERSPVQPGSRRPAFIHEVVRRSVNARTTISIEIPQEKMTHAQDARAAASSPLIPRREVVGALYVDRLGNSVTPFTPDERRLLNTFATQLSVHLR